MRTRKDMRVFDKVCKGMYAAAVVMYGVVQPVMIGEYTWWHGLWGVALLWLLAKGVSALGRKKKVTNKIR